MSDGTLAIRGGDPVRARPWPRWPRATSSTLENLRDVAESSRWTLSGPHDGRVCYERRFAQAFAEFHGVPFCTPTTSGTASLTIALQGIGVGRGDEVLVPGLTWVACASSVAALGADPVLVDVEEATLAMSPERARAACTPRTSTRSWSWRESSACRWSRTAPRPTARAGAAGRSARSVWPGASACSSRSC
jgi:L-glutamine:scyllo-inosose aminotransferase/L-glutamine:2-deoxy-scyllo-inosose/3-amino-2,3-dideoxy-scyllo-inosose aminotransferase